MEHPKPSYIDADILLRELIGIPMSAAQRNAIVDVVRSQTSFPSAGEHQPSQAENCSSST